jgi:hypothetical protein
MRTSLSLVPHPLSMFLRSRGVASLAIPKKFVGIFIGEIFPMAADDETTFSTLLLQISATGTA